MLSQADHRVSISSVFIGVHRWLNGFVLSFVPFVFFVAPFHFLVVDPVRTLKAEAPLSLDFYRFGSNLMPAMAS